MLSFENINLDSVIVHKVGNKSKEEPIMFSEKPIFMESDSIKELLSKYFINPFGKCNNFYRFFHETDLKFNEIYNYCKDIFDNPLNFFDRSIPITKHLYEYSTHPKIKDGEFYLIYLKNCMIDDEVLDGIGLFKTENKETYLKINRKGSSFEINFDDGININKLDKGSIIFNTERDNGFLVAIVDSLNKSTEAMYWKEDFLKIKPREDNYYFTKSYIDLAKNFIETAYNEENTDKSEQIEIKEKAKKYFAEKDNFDIEEFEEEVISEPKAIEAFRQCKKTYENDYDVQLTDNFEISENAAKSAKKEFKSIIKLDKNFHIYIHGKNEFLEKGFDDDKQMNYYKVYFEKES